MRLTAALLTVLLVSASASAVTLHRSFRSRDVGFGGGAGVSVPVDSRVAAAMDEAQAKAAQKKLKVIGKVTAVLDAHTIAVTPTGGFRNEVVLLGVPVPPPDHPLAGDMKSSLRSLTFGRTVTVEYNLKEQSGRIWGRVLLGKLDVNAWLTDFARRAAAPQAPAVKNAPPR